MPTYLETLDDTEVGIAQTGVLSNQCDLNGVLEAIQCEGHIRPLLHVGILHLHLSFQLEFAGDDTMNVLLKEKERNVVDVANIVAGGTWQKLLILRQVASSRR